MKELHPLHYRTLPARQEAAKGRWARGAAMVAALLAVCAAAWVIGICLGLIAP